MDNIYVYDRNTGFILYSIDGATPRKISNLKAKKIPFIVSKRASILNQYVITANGVGVGFDAIKTQEIVLSKPVMEYRDEIGTAIKHYYRKLEDIKKGPDVDDVDKNSPMEAKVLNWIRETNFYKNNSENIDLQAQFPVGEYLKQIEKYYSHPKYKTDFLLSYKDKDEKYHQIIIEYDGFEYHFRNKEMVNELNYNHYYNEDDVYREKVLEGYGYTFLRINRFNLGKEPIVTLNERIEKIVQKKSPMN